MRLRGSDTDSKNYGYCQEEGRTPSFQDPTLVTLKKPLLLIKVHGRDFTYTHDCMCKPTYLLASDVPTNHFIIATNLH